MKWILLIGVLSTSSGTFLPAPELNRSALDFKEWWGPGGTRYLDTSIRPARIVFDDQMIADLRRRLMNHRSFTPPLNGSNFTYGFNSDALGPWISYWANEYPFKQKEEFLNQFPQYKTNIQGLNIHFIWIRRAPTSKQVIPLLLLHGWPGSIREFYEAIPMLAAERSDKDFVLELVVPCLPGFGYSDAATRPGLGVAQVAIIMRNLMKRLGYDRYYVHGGDWGAITGSNMATVFPQEVLGYHTNWGLVLTPRALIMTLLAVVHPSPTGDPKLADRISSERLMNVIQELGYFYLFATKPDTVGIALTDSPAGLLAFNLEKFSSPTFPGYKYLPDGGLYNSFTREQLIDNLMFYWAPRSITTAARLYAETMSRKHFALGLEGTPTSVPTWVLQAKYEVTFQPPAILRLKYPNLINTTLLDFGGHFFALQHPDVLSDDVVNAVDAIRNWHRLNNGSIPIGTSS